MDEEKILSSITDRNVEQLEFAARALRGSMQGAGPTEVRKRQQPGSRPDGGMSAIPGAGSIHNAVQVILGVEAQLRNDLSDARRLVDNFEDEQLRREDEILQLKATLEEERSRLLSLENHCNELKDILRKAAAIMVNGGKE